MGMQLDNLTPAEALTQIRNTQRQLYINLPAWIAQCQTGATSIFVLESYRNDLIAAVTQCDSVVADVTSIQALKDYASAQYGAVDVAADYSAWKAAANAAKDWIVPANVSGTVAPGEPIPEVDATPLVPLLQAVQTASL